MTCKPGNPQKWTSSEIQTSLKAHVEQPRVPKRINSQNPSLEKRWPTSHRGHTPPFLIRLPRLLQPLGLAVTTPLLDGLLQGVRVAVDVLCDDVGPYTAAVGVLQPAQHGVLDGQFLDRLVVVFGFFGPAQTFPAGLVAVGFIAEDHRLDREEDLEQRRLARAPGFAGPGAEERKANFDVKN